MCAVVPDSGTDQMQPICTRFTKHRKLDSSLWRYVYVVIILAVEYLQCCSK